MKVLRTVANMIVRGQAVVILAKEKDVRLLEKLALKAYQSLVRLMESLILLCPVPQKMGLDLIAAVMVREPAVQAILPTLPYHQPIRRYRQTRQHPPQLLH